MFRFLLILIIIGLILQFWHYLLGLVLIITIISLLYNAISKRNVVDSTMKDIQGDDDVFVNYKITSDPHTNANTDLKYPLNTYETVKDLSKEERLLLSKNILKNFQPADNEDIDFDNFTLNQSSNTARKNNKKPTAPRWIQPDEVIEINGLKISSGMIYIDENPVNPDRNYYNDYDHQSFINPKLKAETENCNYQDVPSESLYSFSYCNLAPQQKGCFLKWLATGKNDPDVFIGYVYTYFYGIERRLLKDIANQYAPKSEIPSILNELRRLLELLQSKDPSTPQLGYLQKHINDLLFYMQLPHILKKCFYKDPASAPTYNNGMPFALQIGLAQMSLDNVSLPADWALSWYLSIFEPPVYARVPSKRCYDEFSRLFVLKYNIAFPNGLKITPNKTKWELSYYPLNTSIRYLPCLKQTDLPDISRVKKTINQITPIIEECYDDLKNYSRFIGKTPEKKEMMDAYLLLSPLLWQKSIIDKVNQLNNLILAKNKPISLKFNDFLKFFPLWENKSKNNFISFLNILEFYFNLGVEPDCRLGGSVPKENSTIVLFPLSKSLSLENYTSFNYSFASLVVFLNVAIAKADKHISQAEMDLLSNQIDCWTILNSTLKLRLKAYVEWLKTEDIKLTGIKKRAEKLEQSQKELLVNMIIQIAKADGSVSVDEMKVLDKIFKILELDKALLYSQLNQAQTEPLVVSTDLQYTDTVPSSNTENADKLQIDFKKLASSKQDSAKVETILKSIFVDDTDTQNDSHIRTEISQPNGIKSVIGLSPTLSEIVMVLTSRTIWNLDDLEHLASKHNLMLDGMLEEINDAAFEAFNEPLLEDNDYTFEINQDIVKELTVNE